MTASDTQEPAEIACPNCEHLFVPNLGVPVYGNVTTSPDGGPAPYLTFCSPDCADEWHAKHGDD